MTRFTSQSPQAGRRHFLRVAAAITSLASLGHGSGVHAQEAAPRAIRIGVPDSGFEGKSFAGANPLSFIADDRAFEKAFEPDGIAVQWSYFKGQGPAVNEALASSRLDLVWLGDLAAVIGRANGLKTRLVAAAGRGGNTYLAVPKGSDIKAFKDIKGKRVAVFRGTAFQLPFDRLLRDAGLTEKDVRFINLDIASAAAALVSKDVDAHFGAANLLLLEAAGHVDIVASTKGLAPQYAMNAGLIVSDDFARQHPQLLARILKIYVEYAHGISSEDPAELASRFARYEALSGLPAGLYQGEFAGTSSRARNSPLLDEAFVAHFQTVIEGARNARIIRNGFDVGDWVDASFVNQAVRELDYEGFWKP